LHSLEYYRDVFHSDKGGLMRTYTSEELAELAFSADLARLDEDVPMPPLALAETFAAWQAARAAEHGARVVVRDGVRYGVPA
jgi:hypothetical protein